MTVITRVLAVVDTLLCVLVFFPLAVLYWRGTWGLQDVFLATTDQRTSAWTSFSIGASTSLAAQLVQPVLLRLATSKRRLLYTALCRLHLYICGWGTLCYWRGVWNLVDLYTGVGWRSSLAVYCVWQMLAFVTCTARTNVGLPLSIQLDTDPDLLRPNTAFDVKPDEPVWFALDVCFSQFVIVSGNVCVWRGMWNVVDTFLLPHAPVHSEVASLLLGLAGLGLLFLLQWPTSVLSARLALKSSTYQLLFEDAVFLFATWANVLLWRGGWDMCVRYVRSENAATVEWTTHALGAGALLALQLLNNVTLNGIDKDGSYSGGTGIYPTKFLRACVCREAETEYDLLGPML
ncbi:hypothetical protein NP493_1068g02015 [Ridgeia piscesae]|uniref:Fuseless n=1 Tax=Ridgeia piscesae TaxID=27915 RepID=A0AAD9KGV0_RIDPI|nr:hypothetical protein NP493_1068g02015 [Ridgeia piscesae]